jgi:hypothetical protein
MEKIKTIHGHYSNILEEEAKRLQKLYKEKLNVDITWMEATSIAGLRSSANLFDFNKLKQLLAQLRGL